MNDSKARRLLSLILLAHAVVGALVFRFGTDLQDEGLLLAWGKRILEGELPYTDFYAVQAPGTFYLAAALRGLVGPSMVAGRLFMQFEGLVIVALAYAVARKATNSPLAAVIAAGATATFSAAHHFRMPWYSTDACICLLLAAWSTCFWLERRRLAYLFGAGAALGLGTLFKQNLGVLVAFAIGSLLLWFELVAPERMLRTRINHALAAGTGLVAGFCVGLGSYLAYYVSAGGSMRLLYLNGFVWSSEAKDFESPLEILLYPIKVFALAHRFEWALPTAGALCLIGVVVLSSAKLSPRVRGLGVLPILGACVMGPDVFVRIYVLSFVNVVFFGIAAASLIEVARSSGLTQERRVEVYACCLVAVIAAVTTYAGAIPGGGWGRMVGTWAGCLLSIGIGGHLISTLDGVTAAWWRGNVWFSPRSAGIALGSTALLVSSGLLAKNQAFRPRLDVPLTAMTEQPRSPGWLGIRGDPQFVQDTDAVIEAVKSMPENDRQRLYVFPLNCALYSLADAKNATRFDSHQVDFLAPSRFDQLLTELDQNRPAAIVYQRKPNAASGAGPELDTSWVRDDIRASVLSFMHAHYKLVRSWSYYELWLPQAGSISRWEESKAPWQRHP